MRLSLAGAVADQGEVGTSAVCVKGGQERQQKMVDALKLASTVPQSAPPPLCRDGVLGG